MKRPMVFSGPTDTDDVAAGDDEAWWYWDYYGCWSKFYIDGSIAEGVPPGEYAPSLEVTP